MKKPLLLVRDHIPVLALICAELNLKIYRVDDLKKAQIIFNNRAHA